MPATILIVDDYADNRELLRLMLEQAGYRVMEAAGGGEGIDMARTQRPDLALVDLSMPGVDGWRVLSELRADDGTRGIPCAAISAFADGARDQALAHGFNAYITKPFRRSDLIETVERMLSERAARGELAAESGRQEEVI